MATVFEGCTTGERSFVVRFCGQKDSVQRIFIKKYFLFTVGSICRVKQFSLCGKHFTHDEEFETKVWKWLRRQSKDFYAAGFHLLLKRWGNCIDADRRYIEK
jgi:hypothetical protein